MEDLRFDKNVLRFMTPLEGMVSSLTLHMKNVGDFPVVYKVVRSSDKYHFLVQPRMGRVEPGGVSKIILLFRGGLIRRKSSLRIDFATLASHQTRDLSAVDFWNAKYLADVAIHGIAVSKTTFKIEIVDFNMENCLFETQLFTSARASSDVKTINTFSKSKNISMGNRVESSADISAISELVRRSSVAGGANDCFGGGENGGGSGIRVSTRVVKQSGRGFKRVGSGGDTARLGRMATFMRGPAQEETPADANGNNNFGGGGEDERTRSWRSLRLLKRPAGYGVFGASRSFGRTNPAGRERQLQKTRSADEENHRRSNAHQESHFGRTVSFRHVESQGSLRGANPAEEESHVGRMLSTRHIEEIHAERMRSSRHSTILVQPDESLAVPRTRSHQERRYSKSQGLMYYKSPKSKSASATNGIRRVESVRSGSSRSKTKDEPKKRNINRVGRRALVFKSSGPSQDGILLENYSNKTQTFRVRTTDSSLFFSDVSMGIMNPNTTTKINTFYTGLPFPESSRNYFQVDVANSNTNNPAMFWEAQAQVKPKVFKLLFEVKFQPPEKSNVNGGEDTTDKSNGSYEGSEGNLSVPKRALSNMKEEPTDINNSPPSDGDYERAKTQVFLPSFSLTSPPSLNGSDVLPRLTITSLPSKKEDLITSIASSTELPDLPSQPSSRKPSGTIFAPYSPPSDKDISGSSIKMDVVSPRWRHVPSRHNLPDLRDATSEHQENLDVRMGAEKEFPSRPPSRNASQPRPRYSAAPPPPEKEPMLLSLPLSGQPNPKEDFLNYQSPSSTLLSPSPVSISYQQPDVFAAPPSRRRFMMGRNNSKHSNSHSQIPFFGTPDGSRRQSRMNVRSSGSPIPRYNQDASFTARNDSNGNSGNINCNMDNMNEESASARRTKSGASRNCGLRQSSLRSSRRRGSKLGRTLSDAWTNLKRESSSFRRRKNFSNNNSSSNIHSNK